MLALTIFYVQCVLFIPPCVTGKQKLKRSVFLVFDQIILEQLLKIKLMTYKKQKPPQKASKDIRSTRCLLTLLAAAATLTQRDFLYLFLGDPRVILGQLCCTVNQQSGKSAGTLKYPLPPLSLELRTHLQKQSCLSDFCSCLCFLRQPRVFTVDSSNVFCMLLLVRPLCLLLKLYLISSFFGIDHVEHKVTS